MSSSRKVSMSYVASEEKAIPVIGEMQLERMHVTASVLELTASVQLSYFYCVPEDLAMSEAKFVLPIDEAASICRFEVNMFDANAADDAESERSIVASVVTKEEAEDLSRQAEHKASEGDNPSIFSYLHTDDGLEITIRNWKPTHTLVHVEVVYVTPLMFDLPEHSVEFLLSERVIPSFAASTKPRWGTRWQALALQGGVSWTLNLPEAWLSHSASAFSLLLDAELHCIAGVLGNVQPLHWSYVSADTRRQIAVSCLLASDQPLPREGVRLLLQQPQEQDNSNAKIEVQSDGQGCAMVTLYPESFPDHLFLSQRSEIIFLIDCSGSMRGRKMEMTIASMTILLRSLEQNCYFNLFMFGSDFRSLWLQSKPYTKESFSMALSQVQSLEATMGGTSILPPLEAIFALPPVGDASVTSRQVFLLTDGEVTNPTDCIDLCQQASDKSSARVFSLGIGAAASVFLVEGVSRATGGTSALVTDREVTDGLLDFKLVHLLRCATIPCVTRIAVDWRLLDLQEQLEQEQELEHQGPAPSAAPAPEQELESTVSLETPEELLCPITHELMVDPCLAMDGRSYERAAIEHWFTLRSSSPLTNVEIEPTLIPNAELKAKIDQWRRENNLPAAENAASAEAQLQPTVQPLTQRYSMAVFRQAPHQLPPLFPNKSYVVYANFQAPLAPVDSVRVSMQSSQGAIATFQLPVTAPLRPSSETSSMKLLTACERIKNLEAATSALHLSINPDFSATQLNPSAAAVEKEIIELSTQHDLLSKHTLFIANNEEDGEIEPLKQKSAAAAPSGISGSYAIINGVCVQLAGPVRYSKPGKHGSEKAMIVYIDPKTNSRCETLIATRNLVVRPASGAASSSASSSSSPLSNKSADLSKGAVDPVVNGKFRELFNTQEFDGSYSYSDQQLAAVLDRPLSYVHQLWTTLPADPVYRSIVALAVLHVRFSMLLSVWQLSAQKTKTLCLVKLSASEFDRALSATRSYLA